MRELTREPHHHGMDPPPSLPPSLPNEADTHPFAKGWKFEHTNFSLVEGKVQIPK